MPAVLKDPRGVDAVVVGGGKTGAAAARLLLRLKARVTVCDDAPVEQLRAGLGTHGLDPSAVTLRAGGIAADVLAGAGLAGAGLAGAGLAGAGLVVLSPGVPRAHAAVAHAIARGALVVNEVELAAAQLPSATVVVGITGTNGKSTTTTMAGAIASAFDPHAFVGGNLGTPYCEGALAVLDGEPAPAIAVLELSSYQLETIRHLRLRAAVVTNLSPDHLDRYPDAAAYYAAKARIFDLVDAHGGVALNATDLETRAHLVPRCPGSIARCDFDVSEDLEGIAITGSGLRVRLAGTAGTAGTAGMADQVEIVPLANALIVGHHNRQNAAAAVAALALCGVPPAAWRTGLQGWSGIAHRLERVGAHGGVTWFNDSKGTNVDATVTALKSFEGGIHLIAGGLGKGAPYTPLVDVARGRVAAVYTIGADAPAIARAFAGIVPVEDCGTLGEACSRAARAARPGETILLSPACASFDQFRDYAHRGEAFRSLFATYAAAAGADP